MNEQVSTQSANQQPTAAAAAQAAAAAVDPSPTPTGAPEAPPTTKPASWADMVQQNLQPKRKQKGGKATPAIPNPAPTPAAKSKGKGATAKKPGKNAKRKAKADTELAKRWRAKPRAHTPGAGPSGSTNTSDTISQTAPVPHTTTCQTTSTESFEDVAAGKVAPAPTPKSFEDGKGASPKGKERLDPDAKREKSKRANGKKKVARSGGAVIQGLVQALAEVQGEKDALREVHRHEDAAVDARPVFLLPVNTPDTALQFHQGQYPGWNCQATGRAQPLPEWHSYRLGALELGADRAGTLTTSRWVPLPFAVMRQCPLTHTNDYRLHVHIGSDPNGCDCEVGQRCQVCALAQELWLVDQVYYITPEHILRFITTSTQPAQARVYSLHLRTLGVRGGLFSATGHPEVRWLRSFSDPAKLQMSFTDGTSDVWLDPLWMAHAAYNCGGDTLVTTVLGTYGPYQLTVHQLWNSVIPPLLAATPHYTQVTDSYHGMVNVTGAGLEEPARDTGLVAYMDPEFLHYAGTIYPKRVLVELTEFAAFLPRDAKLLVSLVRKATRLLHTTNFDAIDRDDLAPKLAAVAMRRLAPLQGALSEIKAGSSDIEAYNTALVDPADQNVSSKFFGLLARTRTGKRLAGVIRILIKCVAATACILPVLLAARKLLKWFFVLTLDRSRAGVLRERIMGVGLSSNKVLSLAYQVTKHLPQRMQPAREFVFGSILAMLAPRTYRAYSMLGALRPPVVLARTLQIILQPFNYIAAWVWSYITSKGRIRVTYPSYCPKDRMVWPPVGLKPGAKVTCSEDPRYVQCEATPGSALVGLGVDGIAPASARNCVHSHVVAVVSRQLKQRTPPAPRYWKIAWRRARVRGAIPHCVVPIPFEIWLARFPPATRAKLLEAYPESLSSVDYWSLSAHESFPKIENQLKIFFDILVTFDPRLIQGGTPENNDKLGPYVQAYAEERKGIRFPFTHASGMTAEAVSAWLEEAMTHVTRPHAYLSCDLVRMDSSVSVKAKRYMWKCYKAAGADEDFLAMMKAHEVCKGTLVDRKNNVTTKYKTPGTTASGVPDTLLCNTELIEAVCDAAQLAEGTFAAIGQGDDMFAICTLKHAEEILARLNASYQAAGFEPELKGSKELYFGEFCSGRFWPHKTGYRFGPMPGKLLSKMGWTPHLREGTEDLAYLRGAALSLYASVQHLPIAKEFVDKTLELTAHIKEKYERQYQILSVKPAEMDVAAIYEAYEVVYGLSAIEVDEAVQAIKTVTEFPALIEAPAILKMAEQDVPGFSAGPCPHTDIVPIVAAPTPDWGGDPPLWAGSWTWPTAITRRFGTWCARVWRQERPASIADAAKFGLTVGGVLNQFIKPNWYKIKFGIVTPFLEEVFKLGLIILLRRFGPNTPFYVPLCFGLFEFVNNSAELIAGGALWWATLLNRLPPLYMHYKTAHAHQRSGFWTALFIHAGYNTLVAAIATMATRGAGTIRPPSKIVKQVRSRFSKHAILTKENGQDAQTTTNSRSNGRSGVESTPTSRRKGRIERGAIGKEEDYQAEHWAPHERAGQRVSENPCQSRTIWGRALPGRLFEADGYRSSLAQHGPLRVPNGERCGQPGRTRWNISQCGVTHHVGLCAPVQDVATSSPVITHLCPYANHGQHRARAAERRRSFDSDKWGPVDDSRGANPQCPRALGLVRSRLHRTTHARVRHKWRRLLWLSSRLRHCRRILRFSSGVFKLTHPSRSTFDARVCGCCKHQRHSPQVLHRNGGHRCDRPVLLLVHIHRCGAGSYYERREYGHEMAHWPPGHRIPNRVHRFGYRADTSNLPDHRAHGLLRQQRYRPVPGPSPKIRSVQIPGRDRIHQHRRPIQGGLNVGLDGVPRSRPHQRRSSRRDLVSWWPLGIRKRSLGLRSRSRNARRLPGCAQIGHLLILAPEQRARHAVQGLGYPRSLETTIHRQRGACSQPRHSSHTQVACAVQLRANIHIPVLSVCSRADKTRLDITCGSCHSDDGNVNGKSWPLGCDQVTARQGGEHSGQSRQFREGQLGLDRPGWRCSRQSHVIALNDDPSWASAGPDWGNATLAIESPLPTDCDGRWVLRDAAPTAACALDGKERS